MKCNKCKKELGNKDIVEVCYHSKVEWDSKKEMIETAYRGKTYIFHKKCLKRIKW